MADLPQKDGEAIGKEVDLLARELEKLRFSYEQYFLGMEKAEPLKTKGVVTSLIKKLSGAAVQNARLKFRLQQTVARYNTYSTYWNRILKDIEEGRYQRDVFRATLHEKSRFEKWKDDKAFAAAPAQLPADPFAALFDQYIAARKKCNESVAGLKLEDFKKSMDQQLEKLKEKSKGARYQFQVAIEGGKSKIKAIRQTKS